jgi:hypothetical protein
LVTLSPSTIITVALGTSSHLLAAAAAMRRVPSCVKSALHSKSDKLIIVRTALLQQLLQQHRPDR